MTHTPVAVPTEEELVIRDLLHYPNPFSPQAGNVLTINYFISRDVDKIEMKIYTLAYRLIKHLKLSGNAAAGWKSVPIADTYLNRLSSGIYYYYLTAKEGNAVVRSNVEYLIIMQ